MTQAIINEEASQKNKISFKTPPIESNIPSAFESLRTPQQHFQFFGATYNHMLELIRDKDSKINILEREAEDMDRRAAAFIIKLGIIFSVLLIVVASWAFLLGR
jgi:hypothetical protein